MVTNLPLQLTSFVSRDRHIAAIEQLLEGARLVILVGVGGIGKTRLAMRVASNLVPSFADGVWLVELAALNDADMVPEAMATALDVRQRQGESPLATLVGALSHKQLLLVVDNCEHLVYACAELVDSLLRMCPSLRLMATSREPLGVAGETTWRVPLLDVPDPRAGSGVDEIAATEALGQLAVEAGLKVAWFSLGAQ